MYCIELTSLDGVEAASNLAQLVMNGATKLSDISVAARSKLTQVSFGYLPKGAISAADRRV